MCMGTENLWSFAIFFSAFVKDEKTYSYWTSVHISITHDIIFLKFSDCYFMDSQLCFGLNYFPGISICRYFFSDISSLYTLHSQALAYTIKRKQTYGRTHKCINYPTVEGHKKISSWSVWQGESRNLISRNTIPTRPRVTDICSIW